MKFNCPLKHVRFSGLFYWTQTKYSQDPVLLNRAVSIKLGYAAVDQGRASNILGAGLGNSIFSHSNTV